MAKLELQRDETLLAKEKAQLAKGFPQTAGPLYLTNKRLVLEPNQFWSLGFGKQLEIPLTRIVGLAKLGSFEGGTFAGSAGKKLVVHLDDSSEFTFSFSLLSDIDGFYRALATELKLPVPDEDISED